MSTMLKANSRGDLKGSTLRKLRNQGSVPAVVYGKDLPSKSVSIDEIEFLKTLKVAGKNGIISLTTDGETYDVITHDIQKEKLKGNIIHIDFYKVDMSAKMDANVAIHLVGDAMGVKDGGIIQQTLYEVSVRSLPADIPESIEIDISDMRIGDSLQVRDLPNFDKYEINNEPEEGIMTILPPALMNEPDEQQEMEDKEEVQAEKENTAQEE
jgi:large subunit ribosomal protein L25